MSKKFFAIENGNIVVYANGDTIDEVAQKIKDSNHSLKDFTYYTVEGTTIYKLDIKEI